MVQFVTSKGISSLIGGSVFGSYVKHTLMWADLVARKLSTRYSNSDHTFCSMLVTVTTTSLMRIFKY